MIIIDIIAGILDLLGITIEASAKKKTKMRTFARVVLAFTAFCLFMAFGQWLIERIHGR